MIKAAFILALFVPVLSFTSRDEVEFDFVTNGGFESKIKCPEFLGDINKCSGWDDTHGSSVEYFNSCHKVPDGYYKFGVPENLHGLRRANSGNAYCGLYLLSNTDFESREYVQNKLVKPLKKGEKYKVQAFVSWADSNIVPSDRIGFCFSKDSWLEGQKFKDQCLSCENSVVYKSSTSWQDSLWHKVEVEYEALGGERVLSIGVFKENLSKKEYKAFQKKYEGVDLGPKNELAYSYYYLDDVSVTPIESSLGDL